MRFGVANSGGPSKDSTFFSVPLDDRRFWWSDFC
jgi:hypothetical protein